VAFWAYASLAVTLPSTLSTTAAVISLLTALSTFGMSAAPGWRSLRWFSACATFAGLFCAANIPLTLDVGEPTLHLASRLVLCFGGLHSALWIKYAAAHQGRDLTRAERFWIAGGVVLSLVALVPGAFVETQRVPREIPWLHVTYADTPPTTFGIVASGYYVGSIAILFVRALRQRRRGDRDAAAHAVALGAVLLGSAHDVLAGADVIRSPYVLDLSIVLLVLAVGGAVTARFVAGARALEISARELAAAQEQLIQKERLAAVGELAAVVAHEVRNPLAVLYNAAAGLRRTTVGERNHLELVAIVQEEADRLRDIVNDLLEFARPRAIVLAPVAFDDVVRGAVASACNVAGEKSADVEMSDGRTIGKLVCDERLIHQAVVNLVTNALQAEGRRSPVRVDIVHDAARETVVVQVADDGGGVAPELGDRIFAPFFSTRPTGTGLGLTVVQRCAESHGGSVVLRTTPGGGATFELHLPCRTN
jgi:two-component system sensor histidine kinase HydH